IAMVGTYSGLLPVEIGDAKLSGVHGFALGTLILLAAFPVLAVVSLVLVALFYGLGVMAAALAIIIPLIVLVSLFPVLLPFVLLHLGNHAVAVGSVDDHLAVMERLRTLYRQPLVEALLLAAVALQLGTGLRQAAVALRQRAGGRRRLQAASGLVLAGFLAIHVLAVLV
ncbi:MAG: hypothetical protein JNG88_20050, partial [Phycisphaerales bacterium]|nr:hypothetical protein [Phycisphaerales bacterium]